MNPMIPSAHALQPSALAKLSLRDKLLLAQAVHEIGTSPPDWGRVSALLLAHPLVRQQSRLEQAANAGLTLGRIFGTRECERAWIALMRQRGLVLGKDEVVPEPATPTTPKPKEARGLQPRTDRRSQLALAQLLYAERLEELKEQIKEKEEQFKSLVKEIDEIKSGKADARLEMELRIEMENLANGPPLPPSTPGSTAASVAGPTTPASTASTTPKSAKTKGRARGESSATLPVGDMSKASPARSDVTGTGSAPNSASKKVDLAKGNKAGDRRASIDESPTKLVPGPSALPSTPSITLPKPAPIDPIAAASNAVNGEASSSSASVPDKVAEVMTTEEAEKAVADAATEAAVKVLQDEKAAGKILQAEVEKAAEQVVETETNMELSAQAEGNAAAAAASEEAQTSTTAAPPAETQKDAATQPHEAPAADVIIKEKEPAESTPSASGTVTEAAGTAAKSADAAAGANKRKRDDEETEPASSAVARATDAKAAASAATESTSPVKKARTAATEKVPSSDVEMDSEDEAEAAVGVDEVKASASEAADHIDKAAPASKDSAAQAEATEAAKEKDAAMDEDQDEESEEEETEDQVKSVESPRKRTPAKEDTESKADAAAASVEAAKEEDDDRAQAESAGAGEGESEEAAVESDAALSSDDDPDRKPTRATRTPLRHRPSSSTSHPPKPTPPPATSDRHTAAAKRKTAQVLSMLLTEVSNHTHGNLFHAPIKEQDAPDYYTLIKQPLDIKTIKARIKEGSISSAKQLRRSLALMFANSLIYNRPGTEVHRMASEMFAASEEIFKRYEGTQRF